MGKNSLIKSTSKKKKSQTATKDEETKTTAKKKPTKAKGKAKSTKAKAAPKKTTAPKTKKGSTTKKKLTQKELILQSFGDWKPDQLFKPAGDKANFTAPPFFDKLPAKDAQRIQELLSAQYDIKTFPSRKVENIKPAQPKPAIKAEPKKVVDIKELLQKKFDAWQPATLFKPETVATGQFTAPPLFDDMPGDKKKAIREMLSRQYDIKTFPSRKVEDIKPAQPKPAKKAEPEKVVDIKDLLQKKFDAWQPEALFKPENAATGPFAAPPLFDDMTGDKEKAVREMLSRQYDIKTFPKKRIEEPAKPAPKPVEKSVETAVETPAPKPVDKPAEAKVEPKTEAPKPVEPTKPEVKAPEPKAQALEKPKETPKPKEAPKTEAQTPKPAQKPETPKPKAVEPVKPEKAAAPANKAPAKGPSTPIRQEPPKPLSKTKDGEPMDKSIKLLIAGFAVLILCLIGASYSNMTNYYIKPFKGGIEIQQGKFAPMGTGVIKKLYGVKAPEPLKEVYSKSEVYPIIYNNYIDKADSLLKNTEYPDFQKIKATLSEAVCFADTSASKEDIHQRINGIDFMILTYKADVMAGKGTLNDLKAAKSLLDKASPLASDRAQSDMVKAKTATVVKAIDQIEAKSKAKAETKKPAEQKVTAKKAAPAHETTKKASH